MAIEAGGKTGIMAADDKAVEYVQERTDEPFEIVCSDPDAEYSELIEIDVSALEPMVAFPHLPSNGHPVSEIDKIPIDQAYIGSCTNGRIEDLRIAADLLNGHKVDPRTRTLIVPATTDVWKQANKEGLFDIFAEAGCAISTPTCGACLGGHMGVLAEGERCVSTTNRNFVGRMGHPQSEVYLASPATVAASAVRGFIADPRELLG
jgi:3-isopropylmalate/(R)-2-methylmalate dehydratase large subunit